MKPDGYVCRICGRAVRYFSTRFAYAHVSPLPDGYPDHGPIPVRPHPGHAVRATGFVDGKLTVRDDWGPS